MENDLHMEELILEVDKLYEDGDYAECKRRLLDLLDQEPGFGRAHHILGCLYFYILDDHYKAENHLRLAVKFAPNYPAAYVHYARVLNYLNRQDVLLALISECMNIEGINKAMMFMEKGKSFEQNGMYSKAMEAYYEAEIYAISSCHVEEVKAGIKRINRKMLRPLKRFFGLI